MDAVLRSAHAARAESRGEAFWASASGFGPQEARFAHVEDPQSLGSVAAGVEPGAEPRRRLSQRLVGQPERAPVHRAERSRLENLPGASRILGADVLLLHEPDGLVRADRD